MRSISALAVPPYPRATPWWGGRGETGSERDACLLLPPPPSTSELLERPIGFHAVLEEFII